MSAQMELLDQITQDVARCLLRHSGDGAGGYVVAISGGVDSTALALALAQLIRSGQLEGGLSLGWVDHGLRPDRSRERAAVRALALRLDLPLFERRLGDVGWSEQALRDARYAQLIEMARSAGADTVLTAHHADDVLETMIFRLMRGTGPRGLTGIPEKRALAEGISVIRPLLGIRRQQLEKLVEEHGITAVEDPTNADLDRSRNRIRHLVLPDLRRKLGNRAETALFAMLEAARGVVASDEEGARSWLASHCQSSVQWRLELSIEPRDVETPHILHEAFRQLHTRMKPDAPPPPWAWIERMTNLCDKPRGQRVAGPGWPLAERTAQGILLADTLQAGTPAATELPPDGTAVALGTTEWHISTRRCQGSGPIPPGRRHGRLWVDARGLHHPLSARPPRSGERFQPLGQSGDVDLRGFLHNRKVPIFDRDRLPVIVDRRDQIVCVANIEIADALKISPSTSKRIEIAVSMG